MFKRLPISYKVGLIAVIGFFGFAIYQAVSFQLSLDIRERLGHLNAEEFSVLQFSNYVQVNYTELDKLYQAALAESDIDTLQEADQKADEIQNEFSYIESKYAVNGTLFDALSAQFLKYRQSISMHTRQVIEKRLTYDEVIAGYGEIAVTRERLVEMQKTFSANRYKAFSASLDQIEQDEEFIVEFGLVLGIILLFFLGMFSFVIIQRITQALQQSVNFAQSIAAGNLDASIESDAKDETGHLIDALNSMRNVLKKQSRDSLVREREQLFVSGLNDALRGDQRLKELAVNVSDYFLSELPSIERLAFYLHIDEALVLLNSHDRKTQKIDEHFVDAVIVEDSMFETLGQTRDVKVIDHETELLMQNGVYEYDQLTLNDLPKVTVYIPVTFENELRAVIVLGLDRYLDKESLNLLLKSNDALAIALNSARSRRKLAKILEQTQQQAKELTRQGHELAVINEQLEDKTKDLDEQKNKILEKNALLEESQQQLLDKSKALELSGKYKSQFLSTMSHELRTPLNSILLLSEALLENREQNLSEKETRHANVIHNAGEELLSLINDILDLSKVEEGKMDVVVEAIELDDLAARLRMQFEVQAQNNQVSFNVNISQSIENIFYSDLQRVFQVLKNFISNAFKFTETGSIDVDIIAAKDARLATPENLDMNDELLCFCVRDTGIGIAADKQDIIFEAFKQADGTTSRKFGGTGLGLTISRELSHLLGGEVALYSDGEGQGASFMLFLPVGSAEDITLVESAASKRLADQQALMASVAQMPIVQQCPIPAKLALDHILFINHRDEWQSILHSQLHDSPYKLKYIRNLDNLKKYWAEKTPRAIVIESEFSEAVDFLAEIDNLPPVFIVGEPVSALKDVSLDCMSWLDLNNLKAVLDKVLQGEEPALAQVLFVEDNPVFSEVIKAVFAKQQLAVDIKATAAEALDALYQHSYELIVVDLNLPDYTGTEVMQVLRTLPSYQDKQVVLFTAEDLQANDKQKLLGLCDEVCFKSPSAITELADKAKTLLKQRAITPYQKVGDSSAEQLAQDALDPQQLKRSNILLVDDDERNLYSLGSALESEGMVVYQAQSGQEALEILAQEPNIQLALLDIMMPDMDGYEVLEHIRNNADWCFLPVIALTAKAMVGDKQRCLEAGASDYLSKPVSMQDLIGKMSNYLV